MDEFRVLVTGSRRFPSEDAVWERLAFVCAEELPNGGTLTVVHGDAEGADRFAREWCVLPNPDVIVVEERHPVDWTAPCQDDCVHRPRVNSVGRAYCPVLGLRRNRKMVDLGADLVLAFPLPGPESLSRGTWHCIRTARFAGLTVEIVPPAGPRFTTDDITDAQAAFDFEQGTSR